MLQEAVVQQLGQLYDQLAEYRAAMQQYRQKLNLYQVGRVSQGHVVPALTWCVQAGTGFDMVCSSRQACQQHI